MSGGRTLDLGEKRVLIGFDESRVVARMEGDDLVIDDDVVVEVASTVRMPSVVTGNGGDGDGDVVAEIERHKAEDSVRPAAVTPSNIADAELDPAAVFDPTSDPLDALRGGTGLSNVPPHALLVGGGSGPASIIPDITFSNDVLTTPSLTVGTWRFAASNDELGRRSVYARDAATGCNVDLLSAGKREVRPPLLSLTPGDGGQVTMEARAAASEDLVRVIHFDWQLSPSEDQTPGQVARGPSKSVRVDPDGIARYTAIGTELTQQHDFRAVAEDGRGNVSEVALASGASLS